jgi:DNA polymerase-3 subunit delta'
MNKAFIQIIGQKQAIELLSQAVLRDRVAPAYLFAGPEGVGRSIAAKCFTQLLMTMGINSQQIPLIKKKLLAQNHPDLLWVAPTYLHQGQRLTASEAETAGVKRKAPPQIRIEQIREISQFLARPPLEAARSVVVIEEAQTMAEGAANALLKTLEEPGRATIILIAPSIDSLLPTLVSRCQRIPFYRLSEQEMAEVLEFSGYGQIAQQKALLAIAQGSPGEAIVAWQQLKSIPENLQQQLKSIPETPLQALELAKTITQVLDLPGQCWLVDYLQYHYWKQSPKRDLIDLLEKTRKHLLSYVNPRLVWECTLYQLSVISNQL